MILLSISPFIFIQCGSGGGFYWGRQQKRKRSPPPGGGRPPAPPPPARGPPQTQNACPCYAGRRFGGAGG